MKKVLTTLGLLLFAATVVLPLLWVCVTSLKQGHEIFKSPWGMPVSAQWVNYANAWNQGGIGRFFWNSVLITCGTLLILIPSGAMAAYIFARYPFWGSKPLFGGFLGGMMFPHFLVIVPLFFLLKNLNLYDDKFGLVLVYVAYSLSFTVFVLTGFFQSLPEELAEAAMMDGCGHAGTFWKVMLPLAKPGLIVVGVFNAIGLWNEYGLALVLVPSRANWTLPKGTADIAMTNQYSGDWGALFAALVITMIPVLIVYWIFRDKIHETMLAGAIK